MEMASIIRVGSNLPDGGFVHGFFHGFFQVEETCFGHGKPKVEETHSSR